MALMRSWPEAGIDSDSTDLGASIGRWPWLRQGAGCIVVPCPGRCPATSHDGCRRMPIAAFAALDDIAPRHGQSPPREYAGATSRHCSARRKAAAELFDGAH